MARTRAREGKRSVPAGCTGHLGRLEPRLQGIYLLICSPRREVTRPNGN